MATKKLVIYRIATDSVVFNDGAVGSVTLGQSLFRGDTAHLDPEHPATKALLAQGKLAAYVEGKAGEAS